MPRSVPADASAIRCEGVAKRYGEAVGVDGLDLELRRGELLALLGPSGCGKTTMLRLIAGFERPSAGRIEIGGREVASAAGRVHVPPQDRRLGMVFQDYALFPHLTVAENVGYALGRRADPARVAEVLALTRLEGLAGRRPEALSGGQQQRVALARALAPRPAVVLLDEPFSGLDAALRVALRGEVRALLREAGVSALLVTHDQDEALSIADRVAVMRAGRIEQVGRPEAVYLAPASRWVGAFLGEIDVLEGEARGGEVHTVLGTLHPDVMPAASGPVDVLVRPEHVAVVPVAAGPPGAGVRATVTERAYFGHDHLLGLALPGGATLRSRRLGPTTVEVGDEVVVTLGGPVSIAPRSVTA